jgi:hypothetical protein
MENIMNNKLARILMIFVMLFISSVATAETSMASNYKGTSNLADPNDGVQIKIIKPENYIPIDADWPIVKHESYKYVDPITGRTIEHETTYRESPIGSSLINGQACNESITKLGGISAPLASCTSAGNVSVTDSDRIYSGSYYVEARLTNYAHKYCLGGCGVGSQYYQIYQMDASWVRNSTSWAVKSATYVWGCSVITCRICGGDVWTSGHLSGSITSLVGWSNNTQSYVYQLTYPFPNMLANGSPDYPYGSTTSKGYYNNVYQSPDLQAFSAFYN